jgi:hypothetical protein
MSNAMQQQMQQGMGGYFGYGQPYVDPTIPTYEQELAETKRQERRAERDARKEKGRLAGERNRMMAASRPTEEQQQAINRYNRAQAARDPRAEFLQRMIGMGADPSLSTASNVIFNPQTALRNGGDPTRFVRPSALSNPMFSQGNNVQLANPVTGGLMSGYQYGSGQQYSSGQDGEQFGNPEAFQQQGGLVNPNGGGMSQQRRQEIARRRQVGNAADTKAGMGAQMRDYLMGMMFPQQQGGQQFWDGTTQRDWTDDLFN